MSPERTRTIRGPLRYEITASSAQLEAGTPFSVFVRISNPYDAPTVIRGVSTRAPVEFVDVQRQLVDKERERLAAQMQHLLKERLRMKDPKLSGKVEEKLDQTKSIVESFLKTAALLLPGGNILSAGYSLAITASTLSQAKEPALEELLTPEDVDEIILNATGDGVSTDAMYSAAMRRVNERQREARREKVDELQLQPGNSVVKLFTMRTAKTIFFPPSSYDLHIQIEYEMDGVNNQDSVQYKLNIRSPLPALILGSIVGSICGYIIRDIFEQKGLEKIVAAPSAATIIPWLVALIGNVVLGTVGVIAFARKKDAQPILAIEDFWGGLFVGVLAGYAGRSLLDRLLPAIPGIAAGQKSI